MMKSTKLKRIIAIVLIVTCLMSIASTALAVKYVTLKPGQKIVVSTKNGRTLVVKYDSRATCAFSDTIYYKGFLWYEN
ncbi:hypothetical protein JS518_14255 [Clostridiales bacterium FE2010]|nr:hypothetical protein JS518_14255 [Clostridiales bacterium FE2010]